MIHHNREPVRALSILTLLFLILARPALADPAPTADQWTRLLAAQPSHQRLEVHLDSGMTLTGYPVRVAGEGVALSRTMGGDAGEVLPTDQILQIRQERSSASRGWKTGGAIGAGVGALFGLLATTFVIEVGDDNTWDDATLPYIASMVGFATVGVVAGGGLGALIGSGGLSWYELNPLPATSRPWRLEPQLGLAAADDLSGNMYDSAYLRVYVPRRFGTWAEVGPDLGWMRLGTSMEDQQGRTATVNDTWQAGLTARFTIPAGGLEPYGTFGLGWYHREDSWLGPSFGLGVRLDRATAEVRTHFRSADIDPEPSNSMTTVAFGWAFDL